MSTTPNLTPVVETGFYPDLQPAPNPMASPSGTTEPVRTSFLSGVGDLFDSVASNVGGLAALYAAISGKNGSATPGAAGSAAPAAVPTAAASAAKTNLTPLIVGTAAAAAVALILVLALKK
jgi:hypothetical protein